MIVAADVAGYSRLMGRDESGTLAALQGHLGELIEPKIAEYAGRTVKSMGDGLLLEFPSVVDAVRCAVDIQRGMEERNAAVPEEQQIQFRIGINVGDIIIHGDDIFGNGVNVAARLESLAEPGSICVSRIVRDHVLDRLNYVFEDLGAQKVKNIVRPVRAYRVDFRNEAPQQESWWSRRWRHLTLALRGQWLAAGILVLAVPGGVAWTVANLWDVAAAVAPPTMSVAIAPLGATSGDTDASRLAEVLTHNIATRLIREGGWASEPRARVVLVDAAAAGDSRTVTASELSRNFNVRYVLQGELLKSGNRYAANLRLVEAATLEQVWSQREEWQEAEMSAESSTKLRNLTAQLRAALQGAEIRRVVAQPLSELGAMELVLRAIDLWRSDKSLAGTIKARELADEALRRGPDLVPALLIRSALADRELDVDPDASHRDRIMREFDEFTNRAIGLDPTDPVAWDFRGIVLMYLGRWDAALEANATAIKLAPHKPDHYDSKAWLLNMTGRPGEALPLVDRVLAMDPNSTEAGFALRNACEAHLLLGQAEQAIAACERARGLTKDDLFIALFLAAAYANHGDLAKAAIIRADALRIVPGYTIAQLRAKRYSEHPEYQRIAREYWHEGLHKAGFPEQ